MGDFRRAQETAMLALSKGASGTEKKELEKKLALFREKKAEVDNWAPKASSAEAIF
jgi:hypothetical protein